MKPIPIRDFTPKRSDYDRFQVDGIHPPLPRRPRMSFVTYELVHGLLWLAGTAAVVALLWMVA